MNFASAPLPCVILPFVVRLKEGMLEVARSNTHRGYENFASALGHVSVAHWLGIYQKKKRQVFEDASSKMQGGCEEEFCFLASQPRGKPRFGGA